jgi:hypothetical protein
LVLKPPYEVTWGLLSLTATCSVETAGLLTESSPRAAKSSVRRVSGSPKTNGIHTHIDDVYELLSLEVFDSSLHLWGDSAVIVDLQQSACVFHGEQIEGLFRALSAWHSEADGWQLIAVQYTAASPDART